MREVKKLARTFCRYWRCGRNDRTGSLTVAPSTTLAPALAENASRLASRRRSKRVAAGGTANRCNRARRQLCYVCSIRKVRSELRGKPRMYVSDSKLHARSKRVSFLTQRQQRMRRGRREDVTFSVAVDIGGGRGSWLRPIPQRLFRFKELGSEERQLKSVDWPDRPHFSFFILTFAFPWLLRLGRGDEEAGVDGFEADAF